MCVSVHVCECASMSVHVCECTCVLVCECVCLCVSAYVVQILGLHK